jgi:transcriptional regulator with XRE-family HTH domain
MMTQKFQRNVKSIRLKKRLSQDALAELVPCSVSYVSMLERGRRSPPLETVEAFARALKVTPVSLLS